MTKKPNRPKEPAFVKLRMEMVNSPAWRALSAAATRILERLMIEHMRHGGKNNGELICTHKDFGAYGIRYPSIAPAIRKCVAHGFVVITDRGWRAAVHGRPAQYRLTFLPTRGAPATDEWKRFTPCRDENVSTARRIRKRIYTKSKFRDENVSARRDENVSTASYENVSTAAQNPGYENVSTFYNSTHRGPGVGSSAAGDEPPGGDDEVIDLPDFNEVIDLPDFLSLRRGDA
jgi:hypothetical protein